MSELHWMALSCLGFAIFLFWYLNRGLGQLAQRIALDSPLKEVLNLRVELKRTYFTDALKLAEAEIDGGRGLLTVISMRLFIWKTHYSGEISFFGGSDGKLLKQEPICLFPTCQFQFPLELTKQKLFVPPVGEASEEVQQYFDFGPRSPEKIEVLLSHKSIVVRARDGRFGMGESGIHFKLAPSDLVIPIRRFDLADYRDTYGEDDAHWLMMVGDERRYKREGDWADWRLMTVRPQPISEVTSRLDQSVTMPTG